MQIRGGVQRHRSPHPPTAPAFVLCNAEKLFTMNGASDTVRNLSLEWTQQYINKQRNEKE